MEMTVTSRVVGRRSMSSLRTLATLVWVALLICSPRVSLAQSDVDPAIRFFLAGGAYCFRVAPEGVAMSDETEWTILLLTSTANRKNEFRIRSLDPGSTGLNGRMLTAAGETITNIWRRESLRSEFFERYGAAISGKLLRARTVKVVPPRLAQMKPADRAELYLEFADRGSKVDFDKGRDLSAEEFLALETYTPD